MNRAENFSCDKWLCANWNDEGARFWIVNIIDSDIDPYWHSKAQDMLS
jgi:hypothetical protein